MSNKENNTRASTTREAALKDERDKYKCLHDMCNEERKRLEAEVKRLREAKDSAYAERNKLVAALSKVFPSSLERHPDIDRTWEDDWRWIVMFDLPTGQVSWHIHDSELGMFGHLPRERSTHHSWDGHTTEEKYDRLQALKKSKS